MIAPSPYVPPDGHGLLALSFRAATPVIDRIIKRRIAGSERAKAPHQTIGAEWEGKRDGAGPSPPLNDAATGAAQRQCLPLTLIELAIND